jgi:hypothetical protein
MDWSSSTHDKYRRKRHSIRDTRKRVTRVRQCGRLGVLADKGVDRHSDDYVQRDVDPLQLFCGVFPIQLDLSRSREVLKNGLL